MDSFWRLLCCGGYQYRAQGDSNSLLDPNNGQDNSLTTPLNTLTTEQYQNAALENEGVTQQMIDTIGQLEDLSANSIQQSLIMCMECIPSQHVRLYILGHILDLLSKTTNKIATLQALVAILDDNQRNELETIITGLPPSVFGDMVARETTRVLVDLVADTRDCSHIDKLRVAPQKKFIDTTVEMFQQTLSSLHNLNEQEKVIIGVLNAQNNALKMKLLLKYMVFSRCLKPDYDSRAELATLLLHSPSASSSSRSSASPSTSPSSHTASSSPFSSSDFISTTTTTTTTTTTATTSHTPLV